MQRWEYLFVRFDGQWVYLNGEKLEKINDAWLDRKYGADLFNKLGEEGWELVTIRGPDNPAYGAYFFKRPKQSP